MLDSKGLTAADLVRRIADQGDRINPKSVYRLADPEETLEKVDMRVIAAVCHALDVGIGDILTFEEPTIIEQFSPGKQQRMDYLMARHQSASLLPLTTAEMIELRGLVDEAEAVARGNARRLANRKRRLQRLTNRPTRQPTPEIDL
ncbi:MAG: helix-turn-helix domain-containing protein [Capsulimonadaceae bacterium]